MGTIVKMPIILAEGTKNIYLKTIKFHLKNRNMTTYDSNITTFMNDIYNFPYWHSINLDFS